ncbi:MAG: hypothetical protein V1806_04510 [Pseudomonadota bacterium]
MLAWPELRQRRDIVAQIDWELTPQEAFETYQIKGAEGWRHRGQTESYYFYLSTWQGEAKVYLMHRSLKQSQEIAEAPVPRNLVLELAAKADGQQMPRGQIAIDEPIRQWLRQELQA